MTVSRCPWAPAGPCPGVQVSGVPVTRCPTDPCPGVPVTRCPGVPVSRCPDPRRSRQQNRVKIFIFLQKKQLTAQQIGAKMTVKMKERMASEKEKEKKIMTNIELAKKIAEADQWNEEDVLELVERAGLKDEYEAADGDTFESVIYKAAELLGVEV